MANNNVEFLDIPISFSQLDMVSYQYFDNLINHRTIVFNSEIDANIVEAVYLPLRNFELDDKDEPVTLILSSPGGSVSDGFFLCDYITNYKKKLNIIVLGYAASMATVLLAAGGKNDNVTRYIYPSTFALYHAGNVALDNMEAKTAEDVIKQGTKVDKDIDDFIVKNTNITQKELKAKSRKQWFISSSEMIKYNLADHIYGVDA